MRFSKYIPPLFLRNGHLLTIYPSLFRHINDVSYQRERIATSDEDFLDLDWSIVNSDRLVILSHGLEGRSTRHYILGMVRMLNNIGFDTLAWNFRSCSAEMNHQLRFYHSGETSDLRSVIAHADSANIYKEIILLGFSMGGNQILHFLGKEHDAIPAIVSQAIVISVPMDLASSAQALARPENKLYMKRFMHSLETKVREKAKRFPGELDVQKLSKMKTFRDFDAAYTAPIHGFNSAEDYWEKCSSKQFLSKIKIPTLIINALDDPFLTASCYPYEEARHNQLLTLLTPDHGGHVGFVQFNRQGLYWSEEIVRQRLSYGADL